MKTFKHLLAALLVAAPLAPAVAAVSAEEAAKLGGPQYNEVGALKAGNADGTIPPYSGKVQGRGARPPASAGKFEWGSAYDGDKPRLTIDASNVAQHGDKLADGVKELVRRYPQFKVVVYPTHRDKYFPDWILENTKKCATTARTTPDGTGLMDAHACVPFPLPRSGYEVMWNSTVRPRLPFERFDFKSWLIDTAGSPTLNLHSSLLGFCEYWDNDKKTSKYYSKLVNENVGPPAKAGSKDLRWQALRPDLEEPRAWQYIPGQRRVRLAPEFKYDTVSTSTGGLILFDEINLYDGRMDRFDFSKATLREMVVPFNTPQIQWYPIEQAALKQHPKMDHVRWELRRVWEVKATLKPGMRHVQKQKTFYIDADSWQLVGYESLDQAGKLFKVGFALPFTKPEVPIVNTQSIVMWDLTKGVWGFVLHFNDGGVWPMPKMTDAMFSPDAIAGGGIR